MCGRRSLKPTLEDVRQYWDSHLNLTQFLGSRQVVEGSDEFWRLIESSILRHDYRQALFQRYRSECTGSKLLEIGFGLGIELAKLGKLGFSVTGIDPSPNAVRLCNEYLSRQNVDGRALVQNAEKMDFADGTFDAVYSSGVLQHTPDQHSAIDEIWRVLKPGGNILIILYHRHSWFYLLQRLSHVNIEFASEVAPIINTYLSIGMLHQVKLQVSHLSG